MSNCSVIMVSYHTGAALFAAVKSVLRQKQLTELIVVDNGNPPDTLARLQQMALSDPRLRILTGHGNIGIAKGYNKAAKDITSEYILFLAPDCLLPPDALTNTIRAMKEYQQAIVAGCWLQNPDRREVPTGRAPLPTPRSMLVRASKLPAEMPLDTHEVQSVSSAFFCIRKAHLEKLNGFDEAYFLHGSDMDACLRVVRGGGKVICVPRVKVTRMLPGTAEPFSRTIEWHRAKGLMYYFKKHFATDYMPVIRWMLNVVICVNFVMKEGRAWLGRKIAPKTALWHTVAAKRLMILASGLAELPEKKDWYGKSVLVTGATSQIGLCVVKRLVASGAAVLAVSRSDAIPFRHEHVRWIKGDLTDETFHLHGYLVDMVVHCAPLWHLPATIDVLADAEVKRIIAFGSTSIFVKALSKNFYESDMVEKLTAAETEIAKRCGARGIRWTILRPTMIYGVGLDESITSLAKFIDRFGFMPIYPPAFGKRHPVHADDLAIAVLQAAANDITHDRVYNLSGSDSLTYREIVERLFAVCGKKPRIVETTLLPGLLDLIGKLTGKAFLNGEIARRMNDDLVFFHDDAKRDFNFSPRPFLSGGMKDIEGF
ncbi:MAG: glycosyltransferase [Rickettsiales bacterium]|nr:glycosyltransferase [Rickettsiales bacterium]